MSYTISLRTELIKTKRSAAMWICILGAGFIPAIFTLVLCLNPKEFLRDPKFIASPWQSIFGAAWQAFSAFLLPLFVIIVCSMIVQIEYKNNTWKQVFASPQSIGNIFFSKYSTILLMILFLFVMFNLFLMGGAVLASLIQKEYTFLSSSLEIDQILKMNLKSFVSLLGIISIQYWLSLRIKNFIVPIAIGLCLLITAMIIQQRWEHIYKVPYAYSFLTFLTMGKTLRGGPLFQNHELNSMCWFVAVTMLAFFDMRFRKEKG
jgi:hypothetical protein